MIFYRLFSYIKMRIYRILWWLHVVLHMTYCTPLYTLCTWSQFRPICQETLQLLRPMAAPGGPHWEKKRWSVIEMAKGDRWWYVHFWGEHLDINWSQRDFWILKKKNRGFCFWPMVMSMGWSKKILPEAHWKMIWLMNDLTARREALPHSSLKISSCDTKRGRFVHGQ